MSQAFTEPKNRVAAILKTGLIAGACDITCAMLHYVVRTGNNPLRILNYVASAVFGPTASEPGVLMPLLGLLFHFAIATIFSALFFFLYPRLKFLSKNIIVSGIAYGLFVWLLMNLLVVPLSRIGRFPSNVLQAAISLIIIVIAIGLPIAILTYRYYINNKQAMSR